MTTAPPPRDRTTVFLTGATIGALLGLLLGSWIGGALLAVALGLVRWLREDVLHQVDEVDFELLSQ